RAGSVLYLALGGEAAQPRRHLQRPRVGGPFEGPPQHESFVPHVTISIAAGPERVAAGIAALADYRAEVVVGHVHVLENRRDDELGHHGWRPVADAALGGRAVVGRGGLELELTVSASADPDVKAWARPRWERADREDLRDVGVEDTVAITARRGDRVVGLLEGWIWGDLGHVDDLIVDETCRGEGIGRHLLARFEAEARTRGCTSLALRTPAASRAEAFYRHLGWEEEGRQRAWVHGHDVVQFRHRL
ncbi:MAG TPA: GNAT family N-acetyltransferase, partial [Acidimicrobiales bacterium]|nr:GNAT family N-acetyltransferase [Acidimicrobiales bacterium]